MSKVCEISGKKPMSGNNVSHANNRTKRRFIPNLQNVKLYSGILEKYINLNITVRTMKTVEKNGGLDSYLKTRVDDAKAQFSITSSQGVLKLKVIEESSNTDWSIEPNYSYILIIRSF